MGSKILEFIKVEHTLFSLPFIYAGTLLAIYVKNIPLNQFWSFFFLVTAAALGARTSAMAINRIVDKNIDAKNPRTKSRVLASNTMTLTKAYAITVISTAVLFYSAFLLNPLAFRLAIIPLLLFIAYPYMKRISWLSHIFLGMVWGIGPLGGWIAVTGSFENFYIPLYLATGGALWVAGFDIIYATLDYEFDKKENLHSIPAVFGIDGGLKIALGIHMIMFLPFGLLYQAANLGIFYAAGITLTFGLIIYEHVLSGKRNKEQTNKAFFQTNAIIGWVIFFSVFFSMIL